jgi:hypothetical protein
LTLTDSGHQKRKTVGVVTYSYNHTCNSITHEAKPREGGKEGARETEFKSSMGDPISKKQKHNT